MGQCVLLWLQTPIAKAGSLPHQFSKTENVCFFCRHKVELYGMGPWWGLPSSCHSIHLEPSVESVGIFLNDVGWWMVMRVQWRGRPRSNRTFWSAKMVRLFATVVWVNLCAAVSKGKCRWRCQGWMIAMVFSALWGGSDGCDGWLTVWPPSSALRLEIWAGIDSGCWVVGGEHVWPSWSKLYLHSKKNTSLLAIPKLDLVKLFLLNKIPFKCHC